MSKFVESDLIQELASAVAQLRRSLEAEQVDDYAAGIERADRALTALSNFPGGLDGLRAGLDLLPEQEKTSLRNTLLKAQQDHLVNGELIRAASLKNAALMASLAQQSESATYSARGQVANVLGNLLSRKV
ncbi:MAG: hypothetical protein RL483_1308 [Pseudomonadota bacterium]|jgi:uncharacterized membrane protein